LDPRSAILQLLTSVRAWNIALRTAHLAAMGVLLGGHAFDVPSQRLLPALYATVGTGVALGLVEAGGGLAWLHQGRGLMTLAKLVLVVSVVWLWEWRFAILLVVVAMASVGSHMPARFRYYSVLYRKVLRCSGGPGTSRLEGDPGA
jgi:Zn-dependent protease with chaperone function